MGFSSHDDWVSKVSGGNILHWDWNKQTTSVGAYTIGRWYDMAQTLGHPVKTEWGELMKQGDFYGSLCGWTAGTGWSYGTNTAVHAAASSLSSVSRTDVQIVAGRSYRVVFTTSGLSGSGACRIKVGGTAGSERSTAATFTETIVAGATANRIEVEADAAMGVSITGISVIEPLAFTPYNDTMPGALYHGGNVTPATKHVQNIGIVSATATAVPGVWCLVDVLGCYPLIDMNSSALQTLNNGLTLPRYTDGKGVRAYLTPTTALGAVAHNIAISYTNTTPASGRTLPVVVAGTSSATLGQIDHSGVAANNYGPYFPLAQGDIGVKSVESIQLSAATGASNLSSLVLCRELAFLPISQATVMTERDLLNQFGALPQVQDGAYLQWLFFAGAALVASSNIYGYFDFTWG